jgi:hypothetical protein
MDGGWVHRADAQSGCSCWAVRDGLKNQPEMSRHTPVTAQIDWVGMLTRVLIRCVLFSIFLGVRGDPAIAKNMVLHCQGYQPDDRHKLTDEIITLDLQNNIVISIQLDGFQPKDMINAPMKNSNKDVLEWSYDAVHMKYFFNRQNSRLRLFTDTMVLLGIFECATS